MPVAKSVAEEVRLATQVARRQKEGLDKYHARLIKALNDLPDEDFNGMSTAAQTWCNSAIVAARKGEPLPEMPSTTNGTGAPAAKETKPAAKAGKGAKPAAKSAKTKKEDAEEEEEEEEQHDDEAGEEQEEEEAKASAGKKQAKDKTKAPAKKAAKEPKGERGRGVKAKLKELMLTNPGSSSGDLMDAMKKAGVEVSKHTVSKIATEFRHSLRVLVSLSLLPKKYLGAGKD